MHLRVRWKLTDQFTQQLLIICDKAYRTPEVYGAPRKAALAEIFEGCLLPLWGRMLAPVTEYHCC